MSTVNPSATDRRRRLRRLTFSVWGNPLARSVDRAESVLVLVGIGIWLLTAPLVAVAGSLWWPEVSAAAAAQQHDRVSTSAVLTADGGDYLISAQGVPISSQVPVVARWTGPNGSEHTGTIDVEGGAKSGDSVVVWVDLSGELTPKPMTGTAAAVLVVAAATGSWLGIGALLATCWLACRRRFNRRRFAGWEHDWEIVEPLWSGRRA